MWPIRQGDPDRVNYDTRYPVAQSVRDYFSHDVERTVDIGIEAPPIARAIEPALDPLATEDRGRLGRSLEKGRLGEWWAWGMTCVRRSAAWDGRSGQGLVCAAKARGMARGGCRRRGGR